MRMIMKTTLMALLCVCVPYTTFAQLKVIDPVIEFNDLPERCPPWNRSGDVCPRLLDHFGYEIYISPLIAEATNRDFNDIINSWYAWADESYYDGDIDRLLSKRVEVFLGAFDQVFVPSKGRERLWGLWGTLTYEEPTIYSTGGSVNYLLDLSAFGSHRIRHDMLRFYVGLDYESDRYKPCSSDQEHYLAVYCGGNAVISVNMEYSPTQLEMIGTLIHEYAHAWHDLFVPNGFDNGCIKLAFEYAIEDKRNPFSNGYWTTNAAEFFAESAMSYYDMGHRSSLTLTQKELAKQFPVAHDMIYYMMNWYPNSSYRYDLMEGLDCTYRY